MTPFARRTPPQPHRSGHMLPSTIHSLPVHSGQERTCIGMESSSIGGASTGGINGIAPVRAPQRTGYPSAPHVVESRDVGACLGRIDVQSSNPSSTPTRANVAKAVVDGSTQQTTSRRPERPQIERPHTDRPSSSRVTPTDSFDGASAGATAAASLSARDASKHMSSPEDRRAAYDTLKTIARPPRLIMQELQRALTAQRIATFQASPMTLRCQWLSLKFDVEIAPLDRSGTIHAVRSRRSAGEPWQFKDVCNRLLGELRFA
eukprot:TRINITY_DN11908_c0_g1_i1.p1 TRINITY_DN11908_c0_g1~~TRINITY_DN11908_c0_g1_i1.p1  ORF type:complete len:262 (-),score=19.68 TRINITY_DN11908_c0_g1_i1:394-1179(-)